MNVNLKYIASSGNVYNLKGDGIRTKTANYHKWNWGVNGTTLQYGIRVSDFKRDPATYETRLILHGTYTQRKALLDAMHDDFELDVRNMTLGRVVWGDYYIDCYILMSSTYPDENNVWTDNDLTIYCPYPFWIQEETRTFYPQDAPEGETFLDYEFDYQYDYYYGSPGLARWVRDFPWGCEFRLTLYGPSINPQVTINGHPYLINDTLEASDYVVIDSRSNKVTKYLANGTTLNIFDLRGKVNSVFQQIPGGTLTMNWAGTWGFDLTLYEERSEPRWIMS